MYSVSEAAERNKGAILRILTEALAQCSSVVEIGSGTGQHALHFASHLPHLSWQPSDIGHCLPGLRERIAREGPANLRAPIELDVRALPWPIDGVHALFTANTLHIMGWTAVRDLFRGAGTVLSPPGIVCIYGPFRYGGRCTSTSNAEFDRYLKARDPQGGIRDFESVNALAHEQDLELVADHAMPANNQLLVWRRLSPAGG
jgi:Protein of unknown function (DUF938)